MNLHRLLQQRASDSRPLRVGLIGAGKFGSMYLAQARRTPGVQLAAVADLDPARARQALTKVGWPAAELETVRFTDDVAALISSKAVEIVIDATGSPAAGIRHVLACCEHGKHVVMVNVEADALAGPLLAQRARAAGIVVVAPAGREGQREHAHCRAEALHRSSPSTVIQGVANRAKMLTSANNARLTSATTMTATNTRSLRNEFWARVITRPSPCEPPIHSPMTAPTTA
mgnify:CR=1 FL=1